MTAARAELAEFAAGDRERMASRYHRGALLSEPMTGDSEWDVEEVRSGLAEAAAEVWPSILSSTSLYLVRMTITWYAYTVQMTKWPRGG